MTSECKGMPRYLEMLAKAHAEGAVPKDIRFRRAKVVSKPVLVRELSAVKAKLTAEDRYAEYRKAQVGAALKVCDSTDMIKSAGNGL